MGEYRQRRLADFRRVIIGEAGGVERDLAPLGWRRLIDGGRCLTRAFEEGWVAVLRQARRAVDAGELFHQKSTEAVFVLRAPVHERRNKACCTAVLVGLRQARARRCRRAAGAVLIGAVAQHEMREVDIPFMRRGVGAFGHKTHVAQRAGIHDALEIRRSHTIDLAGCGFIDQIEQAREGIAQAKTTPAAMAYVEHPAHFRVERLSVEKLRVAPGDGMARRRAGIHGHLSCLSCCARL